VAFAGGLVDTAPNLPPDTDAGQGSSSTEEQRQGLLSSLRWPGQARLVQHVSWLEPIMTVGSYKSQ